MKACKESVGEIARSENVTKEHNLRAFPRDWRAGGSGREGVSWLRRPLLKSPNSVLNSISGFSDEGERSRHRLF